MAKYAFRVLIAFCGLALFHGCKKDSSVGATFSLNIYAISGQGLVNGGPNYLAMNNTYFDAKGYKFTPAVFKFYVSHLSLIKQDNTLQNVNTVALADYTSLYLGQPVVVSGSVPSGTYKGIKFWLGVDSILNNLGPAQDYASTNPLSIDQGTWWSWNVGYRFLLFEGVTDSIKDDTVSRGYTGFGYHTGINSLYTEVDLPSTEITIPAYKTVTRNMNIDVNHIFYSPGDTLILYKQPYTHTYDNYQLGQQIMKNMALSFSLQQP